MELIYNCSLFIKDVKEKQFLTRVTITREISFNFTCVTIKANASKVKAKTIVIINW